ncbi:MAG: apolipoprotein N-acyltransferase [Myxococcales bacterium]|nr:apolipoprotein N-acyltransferase [Myxococcales bacterium]
MHAPIRPPAAQFKAGALRVDRYQLDNGLTVLHQHDAAAPVVSYQTWFRVGSRHERAGRTGIAHLFEHLMFKGTANRPEGEFDRILEAMGGRTNAATWLDWTFYYQDVPAAGFEEVVTLEADRMEHLTLDDAQLEAEREVVINERKERVENDPGGKLSELLWREAFTAHPYGHPTLGWMDDLKAIDLNDCLAFYRAYYAPDNAVIAIAGDVTAERAVGAIEAAYGHLAAQGVAGPKQVVEPRQAAARSLEMALPLSAERLVVGYHAPAVTDPMTVALEVLHEALFEGDSARLQRALITEGELASGFYGFVPGFRDPGLYEISVDLRPGVAAEAAEAVLLSIFADAARDGLTDAELDKARNRIETRFYRQLQTVSQRAQGLGFWHTTADDFSRLFTIAEAYRAVTAEDVQRGTSRRDRSAPIRGFHTPLLFGATSTEPAPTPRWEGDMNVTPYNSAWLLDGDGTVAGRYDKVYLLVFGEYVPFARYIPWIYKLIPAAGALEPGRELKVIETDLFKVKPLRLGVLICYEGILAGFTRELAEGRPHVLINLTNDDWFGKTAERYLHFALTVPRSIEHRLAFVRSTLTGVSAFVDPVGRIRKQTRPVEPETLVDEVPLLQSATVYQIIGDAFAWACLALMLGFYGWGRWRRR